VQKSKAKRGAKKNLTPLPLPPPRAAAASASAANYFPLIISFFGSSPPLLAPVCLCVRWCGGRCRRCGHRAK
jgi:hypothetical protein